MNKKNLLLLLVLLMLLAGYLLLEMTKVTVKAEDYEEKAAASALTAQCFEMIKELKIDKGIPINPANDINLTGMIGQDYSEITTTLGNLESKRTSANPNMAAVILDMFHALQLKSGDCIAVNCSGSFPALNIAVLCAAEVMELQPVMISSIGASTHGANDPDLTYLDMEHYLYEHGLLSNKSVYFSIGGDKDIGTEMKQEIKDTIVRRLQNYGYLLLFDDDLMHNIQARYALYQSCTPLPIKCFINVGGNDASFGDSAVMVHADGGILTALSEKDKSTGLVQLFLRDHVPVIHMLNIKGIAAKYNLPIDPSPIPQIGDGGVYDTCEYNKALAAMLLFFLILSVFLLYKMDRCQDQAEI